VDGERKGKEPSKTRSERKEKEAYSVLCVPSTAPLAAAAAAAFAWDPSIDPCEGIPLGFARRRDWFVSVLVWSGNEMV
jgi:hypothetical protein